MPQEEEPEPRGATVKWFGALRPGVQAPQGALGRQRQPRNNTGLERRVSSRKANLVRVYWGMLGKHTTELRSFRTSGGSASLVYRAPKGGNCDATDRASCASKYRSKGKAESLTAASGPSPHPLSPVSGCRF